MNWNNLSRTFKVSFITGLSFTTLGLIFTLTGLSGLGAAFFFFLPMAIGISSGILPEPRQALQGTLISLAFFSVVLLFTQIEGLICVLMAVPIIIGAVMLGWLAGRTIRKYSKKDEPNIKATVAPFLLFIIANFFEVFSGTTMMPASVSTTLVVHASPAIVYQSIIAVDTVDVETNFLQKLGLPTPRKCILTEEKIGGLRICQFEEGQIIETIKEYKKNELLRMEVTKSDLGLGSWLQFDEDIYTIQALTNGNTAITRTTSYLSNLKPRKYWELMESITILSEQEFVFRNLKKDIQSGQ